MQWKIAWHNVFVKRRDVEKYEGMLSTEAAPAHASADSLKLWGTGPKTLDAAVQKLEDSRRKMATVE